MIIAINCIYYTPDAGGIKEYIQNLVNNISKFDKLNHYVLYITKDCESSFINLVNKSNKIKLFPYNPNQRIKRSLFQQSFWYKEEEIEKFDIFHSPFFYAPKFKKAKIILTVHDLRFLKYPFSYTPARFIFLKYMVRRSINRSHYIISISDFTKNEIIYNYKIPDEKIQVIHEAVDSRGFICLNNSGLCTINNIKLHRKKFLLSVGFLEPRKNFLRLIDCYSNLPIELRSEYSLVIVGKKNHGFKKIIRAISNAENVSYLDFVSREELVWLYANCKIHIFPSLYEGFGFPSLEAGLFGIPTIGANQSSIPEIAGKGGVYFDPLSPNNMKETITNVLTNEKLYDYLSEEAFKNVKRFSWENNALKTIDVYRRFKQIES